MMALLAVPFVARPHEFWIEAESFVVPVRKNEVTVHRLSVDEQGTTLVDVSKPGNYLLNAVHLRQPDVATMLQTGAVWESLWASLTFSRPMD